MDQRTSPSSEQPERLLKPRGDGPATAATVHLATAARVLGISPADAQELAERDEFPCNVIGTSDGYRVPFAALIRILRSGRSQHPAPRPGGEAGGER